jgi:hypothetical protein
MQEETYDGSNEKEVLISLIASTEVLGKVARHLTKDVFHSDYANLISGWCSSFYKKHNEAPGKAIVSLYKEWAHKHNEPETKKTVERLLSQLSKQHETEKINVSHVVELAINHFNLVRMERMVEDVKRQIHRGDFESALEVGESFRRITAKDFGGIDVFRDTGVQKESLERRQRVLIRYGEGIGRFFGEEFSEDSFVGFIAPPKSAKSYLMLDLAWKAIMQDREVAYFQIGDMTRDQIMRRFQKRAARRPIKAGLVLYPTGLMVSGDNVQVEHRDITFNRDLSVVKGQMAFAKIVAKHKGIRLKLFAYPSKSISVNDIKRVLEEEDKAGWSAKVVMVDYADNLSPIDRKMNRDEQVEETWTILRQISEVRKCLVVTATQAPGEGFNTYLLTRRHYSRSKMIFAVVTAFYGINQTSQERERGTFRLNCLQARESAFSEANCCHVAHCLSIGKAVVLSHFEER